MPTGCFIVQRSRISRRPFPCYVYVLGTPRNCRFFAGEGGLVYLNSAMCILYFAGLSGARGREARRSGVDVSGWAGPGGAWRRVVGRCGRGWAVVKVGAFAHHVQVLTLFLSLFKRLCKENSPCSSK